ncbi:uncharacterized protein VTP21DRAFT_4612 [Calcarisporiella thermophila]|uniref:uncharacterized protein n=1 Tax=Calcarisporiella thermophila TaxID=911321 RepID=UPI0037421B4C
MTSHLHKVHPRFAHTEGHTAVAYSSDGSHIITVGNDSLIRLFQTKDEEAEAFTIEQHNDSVHHVAVYGRDFITCDEDGSVAHFKFPSKSFEGLIYRAVLPVRSVAFSPRAGVQIAVASDEQHIRLVNLTNISQVVTLKGHTRSVKWVAFDPSGDFLVSTGCDALVKIWELGVEPKCIKTLENVIVPTEPESRELCTVAWHPSGNYFVVPGKNKDIVAYSKGTWSVAFTFQDGHEQNVSTLAWSPNGRYLGSAGLDSQLTIWEAESRKLLFRIKHQTRITCMSWHPSENSLAYVDCIGQLMVQEQIIPIEMAHPASQPNAPLHLSKLVDASNNFSKEHAITAENEEEAREDRPIFALNGRGGDEDGIELSDVDDFVEDDDGAGYAEFRVTEEEKAAVTKKVIDNLGYVPLQDCFQPGSTPMKSGRRYLAFNMIGVIHTVEQDIRSTVTIEFHDKSTRRDIHFQDIYNYSMAYLGEKGALFAVKSHESSPSSILYKPFEGWGIRSEWQMNMPTGEDIKAICLTRKKAIVHTSKDYIRTFTNSGVQSHIFRSNHIVSMAGHEDLVFILHHRGSGFAGTANMGYTLLNVETRETVQEGTIPLGKGAKLAWIGFTENGVPALYDTDGILCILDRFRYPREGNWVPLLDTRGKKERYWAVGVTRNFFHCVPLKGTEHYPHFPRPLLAEVELKIPLAELDSSRGALEENFLRTSLMITYEQEEAEAKGILHEKRQEFTRTDLEMDKMLLQMIQFACKSERIQRALDLATLLHTPKSLDAAIKIAMFHHFPALAERMNLIHSKFSNGEPNDNIEEENSEKEVAHWQQRQIPAKRAVDEENENEEKGVVAKDSEIRAPLFKKMALENGNGNGKTKEKSKQDNPFLKGSLANGDAKNPFI